MLKRILPTNDYKAARLMTTTQAGATSLTFRPGYSVPQTISLLRHAELKATTLMMTLSPLLAGNPDQHPPATVETHGPAIVCGLDWQCLGLPTEPAT
jgi:hypothetical protein